MRWIENLRNNIFYAQEHKQNPKQTNQTRNKTQTQPNRSKSSHGFSQARARGLFTRTCQGLGVQKGRAARTPPWLTCCLSTHHQAGANVTTAHAKVQPLLCMRNWIQTLFLSHKPSNCYGSNQLIRLVSTHKVPHLHANPETFSSSSMIL